MPLIDVYRIFPDRHLLSEPKPGSLDELTRELPQGFYTTFRTFDNRQRVLGLQAHLQRLYQPAVAQNIQPTVLSAELRKQLAVILQGQSGEMRVRLILTTQGELYCLLTHLVPLSPEIYANGVRVTTVDMQRNRPRVKSTSFITASQDERVKIAREAIFEALLMQHGRILEGMTSNFFYIKDDMLGTAREKVLLGVTRKTVIKVARTNGVGVVYRSLKREQVPALDEAFITSSSRGIVPIVQIDDEVVGMGSPGPITIQISDAYHAYVLRHAEAISA